MTPEQRLEKLIELEASLNKGHATEEDVARLFTAVVQIIKELSSKITLDMNDADEKTMRQCMMMMSDLESTQKKLGQLLIEFRDGSKSGLDNLARKVFDELSKVKDLIPSVKDWSQKISELEQKLEEPEVEETPEQLRDKLETLKGDERTDKSAIKGIEEIEEKVKDLESRPSGTGKVGWGAHPLTIRGSGLTIDKNTRFINFTGTGVTSITRSADGIVTVNIGGGAGGASVATEKLAPTTSVSNVTLNLTQLANTFSTIQWVSKNGQILDASDTDQGWSRVNNTITVLNAADSDVFLVSYTYA